MKQKYYNGITLTKDNIDKVKEKLTNKCLNKPNHKIQYYPYDPVNNPNNWKNLTTLDQFVIGWHYRLIRIIK